MMMSCSERASSNYSFNKYNIPMVISCSERAKHNNKNKRLQHTRPKSSTYKLSTHKSFTHKSSHTLSYLYKNQYNTNINKLKPKHPRGEDATTQTLPRINPCLSSLMAVLVLYVELILIFSFTKFDLGVLL